MIQLDDVTFAYNGHPAVQGITIEVRRGEFLGIMGPNSAGKSTLLKLMSREREPSGGRIVLLDKPLSDWPLKPLARTLTVVSSEEHFIFPFSVEQIVLMGRIPHLPRGRRETTQDRVIAEAAMESTDVIALRHRSIHALSSGERQRVLLARALAQEPQLLLLDEPTVHLDIGHAWRFFELLQRLHEQRRLTVVCALHDVSIAERFCPRLVLMNQGRLYAEGSPREVLKESMFREVFGISMEKLERIHP